VKNWRMALHLLIVLLPLLAIAFDVFCLIDLSRAQQVRYFDKVIWAALICVFTPFAGISYLYLGREQ
jgi:hypothetical protein